MTEAKVEADDIIAHYQGSLTNGLLMLVCIPFQSLKPSSTSRFRYYEGTVHV
jgi:hypothetical protein